MEFSTGLKCSKVLVRPLIDPVIMGIDPGQFRIRPAYAQEALGFFLNDFAGFISSHYVIGNCGDCLRMFACGRTPGKTIDPYHTNTGTGRETQLL